MPNELLIRVVLHAGVIPGAVSLALLALLWYRHTRSAERASAEGRVGARSPRWAAPLLITLAAVASIWVVEQSFELWPTSNTRRFYHAAALIGLVATVEGLASWPLIARVVGRATVYAGATWMLTEGYRPGVLSDTQLWLLVGVAAAAGAMLATLADAGLNRAKGWTGPLVALILMAAVQPFMHFAGYSSGSLMLVGPLAVLTSALLVGIRFKRLDLGGGTATLLVGLVLLGLLGAGIQSEPKSLPALLLVAASPVALAVRFRGPLPTLALRVAAVGLFVAPAMGLLMAKPAPAPAEDDPYADYYP
jgi:hypothetical protein